MKTPPPSRWKPGESGNPLGRKKGASTKVIELRKAIADALPEIINALVESAKIGDTSAAKLLLDRAIPCLKTIEMPKPIDLPADGSLSDQGRQVMALIAGGAISPDTGSKLISGLTSLARIVEIDEIEARLTILEQRSGN